MLCSCAMGEQRGARADRAMPTHPSPPKTLENSNSNYRDKEFVLASYYFAPQRTISNSILEVSFFLLFFIKSTKFFLFEYLNHPNILEFCSYDDSGLHLALLYFCFSMRVLHLTLLFFCFLSYLAFICIFFFFSIEIILTLRVHKENNISYGTFIPIQTLYYKTYLNYTDLTNINCYDGLCKTLFHIINMHIYFFIGFNCLSLNLVCHIHLLLKTNWTW